MTNVQASHEIQSRKQPPKALGAGTKEQKSLPRVATIVDLQCPVTSQKGPRHVGPPLRTEVVLETVCEGGGGMLVKGSDAQ